LGARLSLQLLWSNPAIAIPVVSGKQRVWLADKLIVAHPAVMVVIEVHDLFEPDARGLARPMLRGLKKLDFKFTLTMAAYDLTKLPRLIGVPA
jgi:hypothetical protein